MERKIENKFFKGFYDTYEGLSITLSKQPKVIIAYFIVLSILVIDALFYIMSKAGSHSPSEYSNFISGLPDTLFFFFTVILFLFIAISLVYIEITAIEKRSIKKKVKGKSTKKVKKNTKKKLGKKK